MIDVVELQPDDAHVSGKYGICADIDIITYDIRLTKGKRGRRRTGGGGCRGRRRGGGRRREKRQDLYFYSNLSTFWKARQKGRSENNEATSRREETANDDEDEEVEGGCSHCRGSVATECVYLCQKGHLHRDLPGEVSASNIPRQHKCSPFSKHLKTCNLSSCSTANQSQNKANVLQLKGQMAIFRKAINDPKGGSMWKIKLIAGMPPLRSERGVSM